MLKIFKAGSGGTIAVAACGPFMHSSLSPKKRSFILGAALASTIPWMPIATVAVAQAPAAAPAAAAATTSQTGTVKAISGKTLTLTPDKGTDVTVTVADGAKILQIAPGSKTLVGAQVITLSGVAVGDRVLVSLKAGDAATMMASRVVLMKSTDIAQQHAAEAADWQKRGSGGIVTAINGSTLTMASGAKKVQVETSATTIFRRYSGGSIKFEDAIIGTLAQVHVGDQIRVRGARSDDGSTVTAEGVVSGSFKNLSGTLSAVDATGGSVTLKDLATKKNYTVKITAASELKALPEFAARMLARANGGGAAGAPAGGPPAGGAGAGGGRQFPGGGAGGPGAGGPGAGGPGGGMGGGRAPDLSTMVARLPVLPLSEIKTGDVVMIVGASGASPEDPLTAVTLLTGVEPLLASTPAGAAPMTLSPWTTGAPEGGGGPN